MISDSQGAIWAMKTMSMNCRKPFHRILATAYAEPMATSSASRIALSVTRMLLRQNSSNPSACTAVRKCSSVQVCGKSFGSAVWMSRDGLNAVETIQ